MYLKLFVSLVIFFSCSNAADPGCYQPMKIGPCKALRPRWFFNKSTSKCEMFVWGGCQPNQNNFKTQRGCRRACELNEVCLEPKQIGPCRAAKPRWYYNQTSEQCELFYWGGCRPNGNNFRRQQACKRTCERRLEA